MRFGIAFRDLKGSSEIIDYVDRRFSFVFGRTEHNIDEASITLSYINGPKGGVDKQCQVTITPSGLDPIVVTERQEELRQCIDRCLYRASRSLNRKLKRREALRKRDYQKVRQGNPLLPA